MFWLRGRSDCRSEVFHVPRVNGAISIVDTNMTLILKFLNFMAIYVVPLVVNT